MLLPPLCAVRDVGLTVEAGETWFAWASVAVDVVGASASILAGGALTLVQLESTSWSCESRQTGAVEGVHAVHAGASAKTRIWR